MDFTPTDIAYSILDGNYLKQFQRTPGNNNTDLYPGGWMIDFAAETRIKILADALENKCLIIDTKSYLEELEKNNYLS